MLLSSEYNSAIATAIAQIVALFNPAGGAEAKIILFKNNITVGPATRIGDLVEAAFGGYDAVGVGAGAADIALNPITGCWEIRPKEPAGGFEFVATDATDPPETIYGYALVNHGKTKLISSENFTTPYVIQLADQVVDVPQPKCVLAFVPLT